MTRRVVAAAAAGLLVMAACGGATPAADDDTTTPPPPTLGPAGFPRGPSALDDMRAAGFPPPLIPVDEILSGGPPPDGIPPIDEPVFVPVPEADAWLDDREPVVVLDVAGDVRAYPVQILIWHEIVNDTVGGVPVAVTYCPLCNSAVSYVRTVDGHETTFGTSGRLYASALVMYDRATETLWTHYDGRAVIGLLTGFQLEPIASPLLAWADFKSAFPGGLVLDRERTGVSRPYGTNPYAGYDDPSRVPFLFRGDADDRAVAMQRVVGVRIGEMARAWTVEAIAGGAVTATNTEVGGTPVVILWKAGQASALESARLDAGRDVGSVGVFSPGVEGRTLTFRVDGERVLDDQTGSTWDITGLGTSGELAGTRLERIPHLDTFWFAWSTYAPGTDLIDR